MIATEIKTNTSNKKTIPKEKRSKVSFRRGGNSQGRRDNKRSSQRGGRGKREKIRPEFDQKIIGIRRVTRVVAGGRRFSFSVAIVLGDRKGRVGVASGKATDTALAIEKAVRKAKINMITVKRTKTNSIPHEVEAKYCSSFVIMAPANGRGLVAGSSVRTVLDLAGITDVTAKILSRSKNKINNAQSAIEALKKL